MSDEAASGSHSPEAAGKATGRKGRAGFTLSLKGRALRYLAAREHSRAELMRKLAPHEEEPGQLARVLDELEAKDFINERRVVESVVHRRAARLGAARIKQELQSKGLTSDAIAKAVKALQGSDAERALQVWQRKFGSAPADANARARQMRFLAARGFGGDAIRQAVPPIAAGAPGEHTEDDLGIDN